MKTFLAGLSIVIFSPAFAGDASCTLKSESTSGMNKTCVYQCLTGDRSITISAVALCPLTL